MMKIIFIAIGGAFGAVLRYGSSIMVHRAYTGNFPLGTLMVNLVGSFIIGLLWGLLDTVTVSQNMKLFIFVGVLGSFTTFSTLSLETFHMLRDGRYLFAMSNLAISVLVGIALVFSGYFLSRYIAGILR